MDAGRQRHGLDAGHGLRRARRHQPQPGRNGDSDVQQRRRHHADERQQAADRLDLRSCKRRELHGASQHRHHGNRRRYRRIDREGRFLRGHAAPRIGYVEPIHLHVEQCRGRNIQPDRGCHRQRRRENDVSGDYRQRHVASASAPAKPTTLTFVPPTDYATNVTSLTLELRRSTDPITAAAVASKSLGKPTPSNGSVSMDISTLVDPLPAGSYYGIVISIGPYGSTKSAPSGTFTK